MHSQRLLNPQRTFGGLRKGYVQCLALSPSRLMGTMSIHLELFKMITEFWVLCNLCSLSGESSGALSVYRKDIDNGSRILLASGPVADGILQTMDLEI